MGNHVNKKQEQKDIEKSMIKIPQAIINQSKKEKGKRWIKINEHPLTLILEK